MLNDTTFEFIEKVKELAEKYGFEVVVKQVGKSVATVWELTILNAEVVVKITGNHCIITDKEENSKQFEKSQSECEQESLDYIETLLKMSILE